MIEHAVVLTVLPNDDYYFDIYAAPSELGVFVRTMGTGDTTQQVNFGSIEEMRAVAKAMLNACDMKEQMR